MDGRCTGPAHIPGDMSAHLTRDRAKWRAATQGKKTWNHHLRSTHAVSGYHIQATDGEIGHVEDFIIDDETWTIRYLLISTLNWWPGKKVLVSPQWIERVSWGESKVFVNLSRETIKQSPEYTEEFLLTRDYEDAAAWTLQSQRILGG
jgi:sporulation protein YlmC with PRC-barrel domain